jgi:opacity protein-like surface antigen
MKAMSSYKGIFAALALSGCAVPAFAQTAYPYPYPVQWYIDAGGSITQNETADNFDNGWGIGTGVNFKPDPTQPFSLRAEVNYNRFVANNGFLANNPDVNADDGSMQTVTGFVDGVFEAPLNPWMRLYATGGVGIGWRRLELTQDGFYCNQFFCGPGFGRNEVVASQDSTHFAWNAGAGMNFPLPNGESWFVEARYERIETQEPTAYIPIRFGFRF